MQKASTQVSMPQRAAISCTRAAPQLPHAPARRGACARACSSSSSAAGAPPSSSSSSDAPPAPRPLASRRAVLLSGAAAAAGGLLGARGAWAEQLQLLDESLASQLPGAAPPPADLPRGALARQRAEGRARPVRSCGALGDTPQTAGTPASRASRGRAAARERRTHRLVSCSPKQPNPLRPRPAPLRTRPLAAYSQTMRQLTKALREAIETEAGGAKENEVRRR